MLMCIAVTDITPTTPTTPLSATAHLPPPLQPSWSPISQAWLADACTTSGATGRLLEPMSESSQSSEMATTYRSVMKYHR